MTLDELISHEEGRRDSYALLSSCFHLPDEELIQALYELPPSDGDLYSGLVQGAKLSDVQSLRVDYSKLFVGPYNLLAPPYGSVYLEHKKTVMGDSTMDVMKRLKTEGLSVQLKEAPDHIAIELEFMFFLISKELDEFRASNFDGAEAFRKKQQVFLELHLGRWVSQFADKVEERAQTEFYKNLAEATKSFVHEDLRYFETYPKIPHQS